MWIDVVKLQTVADIIRIFIEKKRLKKKILYTHNSPTHTHALTDTKYTNTFRIPAQP